MIKDRIKDFERSTSWPSVSYTNLSQQLPHDEECNHSVTINTDNQSKITEFLQEIDLVRIAIEKIDALTQHVKRIHMDMLQPMANPKLRHELDKKTEEIKNLSYDISTKLKNMKETPDDLNESIARRRIKESQIFVLTRRFHDTMVQYNQESVLHRERCKKVIVCELELSGNRKTTDELEDILETGFPGTYNFSVLVDIQKAKQSLDQIEVRHRDIIKLENSIKELHNMFVDLAVLVTDQGELIDSIEHNVAKATGFVKDAKQNVNDAATLRKKRRQKKIIIIIIVFVIAIITILLILFLGYFTRKKFLGR